jgi:YD repeat-containing protein
MFSNQRLFVPATLLLTSFFGVFAANAQNPACYNLASLQGSYAVIGSYGANVAMALAVEYLDGNGNLTRNAVVNQPTAGSATGARTLTTTTNTGTYSVNCDGAGTLTRIVTANGSPSMVVDDFTITAAIVKRGQLIATTIVSAQQTPSVVVPGGIFVTFVHTRQPDRVGPPQL